MQVFPGLQARYMCKPLTTTHIAQMVALHAQAFSSSWGEEDFKTHLNMQTDEVLGLELNGELVGFIIARSAGDEAEILTILVEQAHQGLGYARRLLNAAETRLRKRGGEILFLEVAVDNLAAIQFYEKAGFHKYANRPRYYRRVIEGVVGRVDAVLYQKHLA